MLANAPVQDEAIAEARTGNLPNVQTEPLWTVTDVAEYLRLKPETVRAMARRGELPSIKVGKRLRRFKISEIKDWLGVHKEGVR